MGSHSDENEKNYNLGVSCKPFELKHFGFLLSDKYVAMVLTRYE
jgi:hypothetical protein